MMMWRRAFVTAASRRGGSASQFGKRSFVNSKSCGGQNRFAALSKLNNSRVNGHRCFSTQAAQQQQEHIDDFFEEKSTTYFLPHKYRRKATRDRYQLGKELGRGMFAIVYEAVDIVTGNRVAVKVMDKKTSPREICEREFRILEEVSGKVAHNRITPVMDVYEDKKQLYFVLELMGGGDFFEHVATHGRMSEPEAAIVVRKLCYALDALHAHGILHRDIKLENLLVGEQELEEGEVTSEHQTAAKSFKLADFGFAKQMDEDDRFRNPAGTLGYASVEVLERREYGPACDIWSAGIVLYILLAGHPPFPHRPGVDVSKLSIAEQLEVEVEAIKFGREKTRWRNHLQRGAWKNVSAGAKRLLSGMLRLDPAKRFTTEQVLNDPWIVANTERSKYEFLNFE